MKNDEDYICRVCGLELEEPPWGDDSKSATFEHCPCCGVEFGYGDATPLAISKWRKEWLARGATWDQPECKPPDWSLKAQLGRIGVLPS